MIHHACRILHFKMNPNWKRDPDSLIESMIYIYLHLGILHETDRVRNNRSKYCHIEKANQFLLIHLQGNIQQS